jgi:hypothetical protein
VKEEFAKTARGITDLLKADRYNGRYFDRSEVEEKNRLCTAQGWFTCQVTHSHPQSSTLY